ncbi:MAG TPA: hypothetical protein VFI70_03935 [Nitrososphaeraceae archaeon]|nr:hypothetical protein [Nitrososphaeraceae archaeon]
MNQLELAVQAKKQGVIDLNELASRFRLYDVFDSFTGEEKTSLPTGDLARSIT